jgi:hypothetical protein
MGGGAFMGRSAAEAAVVPRTKAATAPSTILFVISEFPKMRQRDQMAFVIPVRPILGCNPEAT